MGTVTVKTSELIGPALDWAVAKCEGYEVILFDKLWRDNATAKGYDPVEIERHLTWQPQRGHHVIVELRNLQLDQRNPDNLTPSRCAVDIPNYSTDWSQGGPIIEREGISTFKHNKLDDREPDKWCAHKVVPRPNMEGGFNMTAIAIDGPTPLIAAMRCYVASKLGNTVEIPKELIP